MRTHYINYQSRESLSDALEQLFPGYLGLDEPIRWMLAADAKRAYYEHGDDVWQYVANVGRDNVEAYAKTLIAGYDTFGVTS